VHKQALLALRRSQGIPPSAATEAAMQRVRQLGQIYTKDLVLYRFRYCALPHLDLARSNLM
jgi:hypothetical protein